MKTIYLIRHAKSCWDDISLADYDRPLNKRGKKNAREMGERMRRSGIVPGFVLSSPAKRARATARRISKKIGYRRQDIVYNKELYHGDASLYLRSIEAFLVQVDSVAIVGHNPTITQLANMLTQGTFINIVTAGVVAVSVHLPVPEEEPVCGELLFYDYPKNPRSPLLKE